MEFRLLGPLEVIDDGRPVDLGRAKEQALLAVLLLHANETVSTDRLVDELWGDDPPASAAKLVSNYVWQLRKALGGAIVTRPPGYAIAVPAGGLDVERFESLVERAKRQEPRAAAATLREALSLWRGPPLVGVPLASFAQQEAERLEDRRLGVLAQRIDHDLALGDHEAVIAELQSLVVAHPYRERFRAQLMLALYRSGRQADALEVYRDGRRRFADELGIEPGPELQRLEHAILDQSRELDPPVIAKPSEEPPGTAARRPLWAVVAASALAVAFMALLVVGYLATRSDGAPALQLGANSVGLVDPDRGELVRVIPVGTAPRALASGLGSLWVANYRNETVTRVHVDGRPSVTIPVGGHPTGVAVAAGAVWLPTLEGQLMRIDPRFDRAARAVRLGARPSMIVADGNQLWIAAPRTRLLRVDARRPTGVRAIRTDYGADGPLALGAGRIWVAAYGGLYPLRRDSDVPGTFSSLLAARAIAVGHGSVWLAGARQGGDVVLRVAPATNAIEAVIPVTGMPSALAIGPDAVWVARATGRSVVRIDPDENRVVETIPLNAIPTALLVEAAGLWVAAE